jgi:elongation factor P--beta-lysine ligase
MLMRKGGVTVEIFNPNDILHYKRAGYVKVEQEPEESKEIDFNSLTVAELKEAAKELGLEGYSNKSKDELIALLEGK